MGRKKKKPVSRKDQQPAQVGRPKAEIDKEQFESLCALQCTKMEICAVLNVSDKTLDRWIKETYEGQSFSEVFALKRCVGFMSLRRIQFEQAKKNPKMSIFLGKVWLGQTDKPAEAEDTYENDGFIEALHGEAEKVWHEE